MIRLLIVIFLFLYTLGANSQAIECGTWHSLTKEDYKKQVAYKVDTIDLYFDSDIEKSDYAYRFYN